MAKLKDYLKVWFKVYHFQHMSAPVRAQWRDLMDEDEYDVVTAETQGLYRDFVRDTVQTSMHYTGTAKADDVALLRELSGNASMQEGDAYDFVGPANYNITVHAGNLEALRRISGNNDLNIDDEYNYKITNDAQKEEYLRVFSPKIGDRFYYNDLRSGGQKSWGDKKTGNLLDAPLPDISDLSVPEQERFYRIIRTTLRNINDDPAEFPDPDSPAKVKNFLGSGKAFEEFKIQDVPGMTAAEADEILKEFAKLADSNDILKANLNESLSSRFGSDYSVDDFITDLKEDPIRPRALARVPTLLALVENWRAGAVATISSSVISRLNNIFGASEKVEQLTAAVNQENEKIDPVKLAQFRDPRVYAEILRSMYDPSKEGKRSAFNDQFASHGGTEITNPMALVVKNFNYDNLDGKYKDKLNKWEQIQKDWGDWKEEHIVKLWKRNLRHNYVEPNAKGVVDAICKLKISPTDGLEKILKEKANIKKIVAQKSPASEKGFDFLIEVLEKIDNSQGMKKAFAGALKNGQKAEAIAKEIIKAAMAHQPPKVGEAKVALETLAVMRYDRFDSAHAKDVSKAISGAKFFEGTSIMKAPGVSFVLNAAQRGIHLGLNATFWAGVLVRNTIQHSRGKISDADNKAIQESLKKIEDNAARFNTLESATTELERAKTEYANFEAANQGVVTASGAANLQDYITALKKEISDLTDKKNALQGELDSDKNKGRYVGFIKEAEDFLNNVGGFSEEASAELNIYIATLSQTALKVMDKDALVNGFKKYCDGKKNGLTPGQKSLVKGQLATTEQTIIAKQAQLDALEPQYNQAQAEVNIAQDIYNFQLKKRNERAETKTLHNPGDAPMNDMQNAQMLSWFWNACNGYDFGLNINDYAFLRAHEHNPQKLQFNAAVKKRMENDA